MNPLLYYYCHLIITITLIITIIIIKSSTDPKTQC